MEYLAWLILIATYILAVMPFIGNLVDGCGLSYKQAFGLGFIVHIMVALGVAVGGSIFWAVWFLWL